MEKLNMKQIVKNLPDLTNGCLCVDCHDWRKVWGIKPDQNRKNKNPINIHVVSGSMSCQMNGRREGIYKHN